MSTRPYLFIFIVYYLWERRKRTQGEFSERRRILRGEKRKEKKEQKGERESLGKKREREEGGIESR